MKPSKSYREELLKALKDPSEALLYLDAALEDPDKRVFLLALRDVAAAQGGMVALSRRSDLNRENLYRTLSQGGNPSFLGLGAILKALGFRLAVKPLRA
jgi:probable addiction module antidote protein